jgi:hypothetical protein
VRRRTVPPALRIVIEFTYGPSGPGAHAAGRSAAVWVGGNFHAALWEPDTLLSFYTYGTQGIPKAAILTRALGAQ